VPYLAFRAGHSYEAGRAQAASDSLAKLDESGIINRASALFRMAATAASPAVVSIQCLRTVDHLPEARRLPPGTRIRGPVPSSFGSGVIVDKANGHIVTNAHVVDGADEILVRVGRSTDLVARLVGADSKTDLAVLQVPGPLDSEAAWADVDQIDIGDWVLAIGSPFMLDHSVSVGIVSAIGRRNLRILGEASSYEDFIQTDAAINPGNSGGPLVDLRGRIVGINTAIYNPRSGVDLEGTGGNVGIGFALSSAIAQNVVEQIIKTGRVVRGYMGVTLDHLDGARAAQLGLKDPQGALIVDVDPESPAAAGGLASGDVVVALDGQPIRDLAELRNRTGILPVGSKVELTFMRAGKKETAKVDITALPLLRSLGLRFAKESPLEATQVGVPIDSVQLRTPAFRAGFRPNQRVLAIGSRPVASRDEAEAVAARFDPAKGIAIDVEEPDGTRKTILIGVGPGQ
jgi:serine protease Do